MSSQIIFSQNAFSGAPVRENDLRYIVNAISHDKCCAVVAPSNMGKSKLLYSLQTEEVKSFCVGKDNKPVIMVFTDCLPIETETGFYQQILNDLILKLESVVDRAGVPKQEININFPLRALTRLQKDANELMTIEDGKAALLLIDRALQRLLRQTNLKIVFIWDEFEQIFERLPGRTFKKFRAIRDTSGSRILCVLGLTRRLSRIRPDDALFEFREVFKMNTLVLRPLDRADSERFLHYVATSNDYNLDDELKDRIISLSGGHPGLMERILTLWARGEVSPEAKDVVEELCHDERLKEECRRLWEELDQSERNLLLTLAKQAPLSDTESLEYLLEAGILRKENGHYCVFSPVFARYIVNRISKSNGLKVIGDNVYIDNDNITDQLGTNAKALILYLWENKRTPRTIDAISYRLWGRAKADANVRQAIKRAREVIEPFYSSRKYIYLINIRGKGYLLNPNPQAQITLAYDELSCQSRDEDISSR